jgi:hypothetical protein
VNRLPGISPQFKSGGGGGMQKSGYEGSQFGIGVDDITGCGDLTGVDVGTGDAVGSGVAVVVGVSVGRGVIVEVGVGLGFGTAVFVGIGDEVTVRAGVEV